ncbi:MAG: hypothetical protein E6Q97_21530 [Desulfurellales bacterium]|nr:MAG: hypothetical protein E6Q97_21530 [Desulfurellales bacterium]
MDKLKLIEAILGAECGGLESTQPMPFKIGEKVFIRTVTYHMTGKIKAITGKFITLEDAAWIADSGRFADALLKGTLSEVEPIVGDMRVNSDTFIDVFEWKHELPKEQK